MLNEIRKTSKIKKNLLNFYNKTTIDVGITNPRILSKAPRL